MTQIAFLAGLGLFVLMFCNPGGDHPDHERED